MIAQDIWQNKESHVLKKFQKEWLIMNTILTNSYAASKNDLRNWINPFMHKLFSIIHKKSLFVINEDSSYILKR